MHSSHHCNVGGKCEENEKGKKRTIFTSHTESVNASDQAYLHPASLSLRAYILPMSPIPIKPTTASPMIAVVDLTCLCDTVQLLKLKQSDARAQAAQSKSRKG